MFYQTTFFVVILVGLVLADRKSSTFLALTSSEGVDVCAVDVPTNIEWFPSHGSDIQCGLDCIRRTVCKAFNFHSLLGKCEHYETRVTNFAVIADCKGYIIADTNDCQRLNGGCSQDAHCSHKELDLECHCSNGYQLTSDARSCQDIDECTTNSGSCGRYAQCINTIGNYTCVCPLNFSGNGFNCSVPTDAIGCFADCGSSPFRDLPLFLRNWDYSTTNDDCRDGCADQGYMYSGTQDGIQCFCGNTFGNLGTSNWCTKKCAGDSTTICGGGCANTVMYTGVIGCFADNTQSRDLPSTPTNSVNTLSSCRNYCYNKGYKFAGLQGGTWCYCGNNYGRYGTSSVCGSGLANTIILTGK